MKSGTYCLIVWWRQRHLYLGKFLIDKAWKTMDQILVHGMIVNGCSVGEGLASALHESVRPIYDSCKTQCYRNSAGQIPSGERMSKRRCGSGPFYRLVRPHQSEKESRPTTLHIYLFPSYCLTRCVPPPLCFAQDSNSCSFLSLYD